MTDKQLNQAPKGADSNVHRFKMRKGVKSSVVSATDDWY
jgi:hypothetical protein